MIVVRTSIVSDVGRSPELLPLLKEHVESAMFPHSARILRPRLGEGIGNLFVIEEEFESLAEMEKAHEERMASPEFLDFNKSMDELRVGLYSMDVWSVVE